MKVWACKIGFADPASLPDGADFPMRQAVARAFREVTGSEHDTMFSGWGASLTEAELAVHENRLPAREKIGLEVSYEEMVALRAYVMGDHFETKDIDTFLGKAGEG